MDGELVRHLGGCHCGAVRFEIMAPRKVTVYNCNCSICTKKQNRHFIVPNFRFKLLQGEDNLTCYTYNTKAAQHTFCKTCGVQSFYTPRSHPDGKGVAPHCLDEGTLEGVTVVDFDGVHWTQNMAQNTGNIKEMSKENDKLSDQ
ncbi:centromere protein V-like [Patiria miniata]|uniref:CENP-V/GFA domain-containing protein n=1 Tax=Patiria miniata TaxID=46514 RepID=A0A914BDT2_PATMI|nr:centromere protein V-like [Patiria miniata]XP_038074383.1 centromere protein V-like [Patiria miniata]XP_038074384.1 centromere protein V-like [Patiria miniata]